MTLAEQITDFISRVASEPASYSNIEAWRHHANRLCNAIYRESNPCPVVLCDHCKGEWEEEAQRARDEQFAAMEASNG